MSPSISDGAWPWSLIVQKAGFNEAILGIRDQRNTIDCRIIWWWWFVLGCLPTRGTFGCDWVTSFHQLDASANQRLISTTIRTCTWLPVIFRIHQNAVRYSLSNAIMMDSNMTEFHPCLVCCHASISMLFIHHHHNAMCKRGSGRQSSVIRVSLV